MRVIRLKMLNNPAHYGLQNNKLPWYVKGILEYNPGIKKLELLYSGQEEKNRKANLFYLFTVDFGSVFYVP